jgi:hypothetical protein
MKTIKEKLPLKRSIKLYDFKKPITDGFSTPDSTHTDPTTTCTTVLTTTHFGLK